MVEVICNKSKIGIIELVLCLVLVEDIFVFDIEIEGVCFVYDIYKCCYIFEVKIEFLFCDWMNDVGCVFYKGVLFGIIRVGKYKG